jgi:hypothetical protein
MDRKSRLFAYSISSPDSGFAILKSKSPKVSGRVRGYSRFAETIGGDRFDHNCRPTAALLIWRTAQKNADEDSAPLTSTASARSKRRRASLTCEGSVATVY